MGNQPIELIPLFDYLLQSADRWDPFDVIPNTIKIGEHVITQIKTKFQEEKYRFDRNEVISYFDSIKKFKETGLPFNLDHFKQITTMAKNRISPYPHYSGIKVEIIEI